MEEELTGLLGRLYELIADATRSPEPTESTPTETAPGWTDTNPGDDSPNPN